MTFNMADACPLAITDILPANCLPSAIFWHTGLSKAFSKFHVSQTKKIDRNRNLNQQYDCYLQIPLTFRLFMSEVIEFTELSTTTLTTARGAVGQ